MFTESRLRQHPAVSKAFTGLPAAAFWALIEKITEHLPASAAQRLGRADRPRALGGGRAFAQPLVIRVAWVLTSLRLPIPQEAGAQLYGSTPAEVARELRRSRPVRQHALPCPAVWERSAAGAEVHPAQCLELEQVSAGRARSEATAQRVSRPTDSAPRKAQYAGKKKLPAQAPPPARGRAS